MSTLLERRRKMMKSAVIDIAVSSAESPQLMAMIYNAGWAANADFLTVKEAARVTNAQLAATWGRTGEQSSLLQMREPFDGFQYFTGVTVTPRAIFRGAKLTSIIMPPTIQTLGTNAFRDMASSVTLSGCTLSFPNITTIEHWVFAGLKCKEVIIGANCTSIGQYTFRQTRSPFIIQATTPPTSGYQDTPLMERFTIYVPDESVDAYKAATNWSTIASRIFPISDYNS